LGWREKESIVNCSTIALFAAGEITGSLVKGNNHLSLQSQAARAPMASRKQQNVCSANGENAPDTLTADVLAQ
jgi:hypothetical protein